MWSYHYAATLLASAAEIESTDAIILYDTRANRAIDTGIHAPHITGLTWSADGRLAFTTTSNSNRELYLWDDATSTQIASNLETRTAPQWSADGRLAFISERSGDNEVYVWDGANLTNISQDLAYDYAPSWSDDGRLAFFSNRPPYETAIYVWDAGTFTPLSKDTISYPPVWSSDGRLAFRVSVRGNGAIHVWDGSTLVDVAHPCEYESEPRWSDDGQLAFVSVIDEVSRICIWDNGVNIAIPHGSLRETNPVWSEDGLLAYIAYTFGENRDGAIHIWDGRRSFQISGYDCDNDDTPAWWSP